MQKTSRQFTHFASLPFIKWEQRQSIIATQTLITNAFKSHHLHHALRANNYNLSHITISMLALNLEQTRIMAKQVLSQLTESILLTLKNTSLKFSKINYFKSFNWKTKKNEVTLIYLQVEKDQNWRKLVKACDTFIRAMLKSQLIMEQDLKSMWISYDEKDNLFKNENFHLTLFYVNNLEENEAFFQSIKEIQANYKEFTLKCQCFDISTRGSYDWTKFYSPFARIELNAK